jgi:hypothetical protein
VPKAIVCKIVVYAAMANGTMANGDHYQGQPPNIYEPKNILITGACGFIASHVAIRLVNRYPEYKVPGIRCNIHFAG